jgi:hypothetical protein
MRGVFSKDMNGRFSLANVAHPLRRAAVERIRPAALFHGSDHRAQKLR